VKKCGTRHSNTNVFPWSVKKDRLKRPTKATYAHAHESICPSGARLALSAGVVGPGWCGAGRGGAGRGIRSRVRGKASARVTRRIVPIGGPRAEKSRRDALPDDIVVLLLGSRDRRAGISSEKSSVDGRAASWR
jgi:hypothetical protein